MGVHEIADTNKEEAWHDMVRGAHALEAACTHLQRAANSVHGTDVADALRKLADMAGKARRSLDIIAVLKFALLIGFIVTKIRSGIAFTDAEVTLIGGLLLSSASGVVSADSVPK